jgi:hypothetical protein
MIFLRFKLNALCQLKIWCHQKFMFDGSAHSGRTALPQKQSLRQRSKVRSALPSGSHPAL